MNTHTEQQITPATDKRRDTDSIELVSADLVLVAEDRGYDPYNNSGAVAGAGTEED